MLPTNAQTSLVLR